MNVRFIDKYQADGASAQALVEELKLLHKLGSFSGVCFGQKLFTLFPTQSRCFQDGTQRIAGHAPLQFRFDPASQLFQRPAMTRDAMLDRLTARDGFDDLVSLVLDKKGVRPPLC